MSTAVQLGPWGGSGGTAFDDGANNLGISKVTIYVLDYLRGLKVDYGNGTSVQHGGAVGTAVEIAAPSNGFLDFNLCTGHNAHFTGDPNLLGVVGLGLSAADTATFPPSPAADNLRTFRPRILGFFGRASAGAIDQLGIYVDNTRT